MNDFINKSYYDLMIEIDKYNKIHNQNIRIIVSKINNNINFDKYIQLKDYYYVNLYTNDNEISNILKKILELSLKDQHIYLTNIYFLDLIHNNENCKKVYISRIYQ
jgi:hypothetical protein